MKAYDRFGFLSFLVSEKWRSFHWLVCNCFTCPLFYVLLFLGFFRMYVVIGYKADTFWTLFPSILTSIPPPRSGWRTIFTPFLYQFPLYTFFMSMVDAYISIPPFFALIYLIFLVRAIGLESRCRNNLKNENIHNSIWPLTRKNKSMYDVVTICGLIKTGLFTE